MPSIIYDDLVSDTGSAIMGGTRVFYVAGEVTTEGPTVRRPNDWDTDSIISVGHWQLGNDLTSGGLITGIGWDDPHWINRTIFQWIPPAGQIGADFSAAIAQYIGWAISPGTEVHLIVFGDV